MNRYNTDYNVQKRFDGKQFFGSRVYPIIYQDDTDILYISKETDYLDSLAYKFYKNKSYWWIIAQANNIGNGRLSIQPGIQLRIPTKIEQILINYNRINSQ